MNAVLTMANSAFCPLVGPPFLVACILPASISSHSMISFPLARKTHSQRKAHTGWPTCSTCYPTNKLGGCEGHANRESSRVHTGVGRCRLKAADRPVSVRHELRQARREEMSSSHVERPRTMNETTTGDGKTTSAQVSQNEPRKRIDGSTKALSRFHVSLM